MATPSAGNSKRTVLVVDDEEEILESVRAYLEGAMTGIDVLTASSGAEAMRILNHQAVDLILADYRMPAQDGLAFLVEAERNWPDTPRIMMTAYPEAELAVNALQQAHVKRFLVKPIKPDILNKYVRDLLG